MSHGGTRNAVRAGKEMVLGSSMKNCPVGAPPILRPRDESSQRTPAEEKKKETKAGAKPRKKKSTVRKPLEPHKGARKQKKK
jgi:hypothetical protein